MILFNIIFSIFFTFYLSKFFIKYCAKFLIDFPNKRSSHQIPTPRGAGIIFILTFLVISIINKDYKYLVCSFLGIIGFIEDLIGLSSIYRYISQLIFSIFIFAIYMYDPSLFPANILGFIFSFSIIIFFTAIINFFNFMDGLNGLVAGNALIYFFFMSLFGNYSLIYLSLILLVFLKFNWDNAKFFMGDSGSLFLGSLTCLVIADSSDLKTSLIKTFLIFPLLFDPFICLLKRFMKGENIFMPHKLHLYQRLHQAGWSHAKTSSIYIILTFQICLFYLLFKSNGLLISLLFQILIFYIIENSFSIKFDKALNKNKK